MAIRSAKGALLQLSNGGSPSTFGTIGQVRSITGPSTKTTVQDVTTHSTIGNWMQKLSTLIDPGDLTFPINWDPSDSTHAFATGLWSSMITLANQFWQLIFFGGAGTLKFRASVTQHSFTVPVDNVLGVNVQLTIFSDIQGSIP